MTVDMASHVTRVTFCAGEQRWTVGLATIPCVKKNHGRWYTIHGLAEDGSICAKAMSVCHDHYGVMNVPEGYPFGQVARNDVDLWLEDFPEPGQVRRWGRFEQAGRYLTVREAARRCRAILGRKVTSAKVAALAVNGDMWDLVGGRPGEPLRIWEAELSKVVAALGE